MEMTGNPTNCPYACLSTGITSGIYMEGGVLFTYSSQNQSIYGELLYCLCPGIIPGWGGKLCLHLLLLRRIIFLKDKSCRPTRRSTFLYRISVSWEQFSLDQCTWRAHQAIDMGIYAVWKTGYSEFHWTFIKCLRDI